MDKNIQGDDKLRLFIERLESLEEGKVALLEDIREVFAEARDDGFDPKVMRQVLKLRKMKPEERKEQEALMETYLRALRMA